ncbi:cell surface protein [Acidovorax sp. Q11]
MRKNVLALSIAALIGGAASAGVVIPTAVGAGDAVANPAGGVYPLATALNPTVTGVGHILTVPYFTTQGTNKTLLNLVNTDNVNGKAVKLRYRGAQNSDDVFDITIYLSPGDVWTAEVAAAEDGSGISRLVTSDTSCTLPYKQDIKDLGGKFKTDRVRDADKAQTREGYIEILNTADVPPTLVNAATGAVGATANPLFAAVKHATSGATSGTPTCATAVLDLQENDLVAFDAVNPNSFNLRGYNYPTGGLFANWTVVNVAGFASFSGTATAVRAENGAGANGVGNIVWFPQTSAAQANGANATNVATLSADPLLLGGAVLSAKYDYPDLSTPYTGAVTPSAQATNLTAALATAAVSNEFITGNGFSTDWILSQPTRRYHVAVNYTAAAASRLVFRDLVAGTTSLTVGTDHYAPVNTKLNTANDIAGTPAATVGCVVPGSLRGYNREELTKTTFVISPASALTLCGEVSVLSFNNTGDSVVGGVLTRSNLSTGTGMAEGWMRVNTPGAVAAGLPIIGYSASKVTGANLGGAWTHRTVR